MLTIAFIIIAIIAAVCIWLSTLEGEYTVKQSRLINTDINTVFDKIRDFKSWPEWSPWLIHEPDTTLVYSDDYDEEGGHYTWDGKYVGAGKVTHVKFERPHRIQQKIEFTRPFKSISEVIFEFNEKDGQTEISWIMNGNMPFFFRFMTRMIKMMINKDYAFGLARLGGILDPASEHPQMIFAGEATLESQRCLCHEFSGNMVDMVTTMREGFPKLMEYVQTNNANITGYPMSVYHKVDLKADLFQCDMAVPTDSDIVTDNYVIKETDAGRYLKVILQGSYDFLELAWHAAYSHTQMLKYKVDSSRASFEIYENDPNEAASTNEIITALYIPLK